MTAPTSSWRRPSARSLQLFLKTEAAGSVLLLVATVLALGWANSPLRDAYDDLWTTVLSVEIGGEAISEDLRHWVNDGLMVIFFYVVGLEIRRELAIGELRDRRAAAVPALAALAGMAVPALVFLLLNPSGEAAGGWGVVMATDIAFVLGALSLLGRRCPPSVRLFLLTLAIVDDIGAVTVIAIFYTDSIDFTALAAAVAVLVGIGLLRHIRAWPGFAFFIAALVLWVPMHESGVHPTIAGVLLGLLTPVHAARRRDVERATALTRSFRQSPTAAQGRRAMLGVAGALSPNERFQEAIHPWSSFVVVPLFALANAGVTLDGDTISAAVESPVTHGVVAGLVVGKLIGISLASLGAVRLGLGALPAGMRTGHALGAAALAGIGFTVSLFMVELAFDDPQLREQGKTGVLAASVMAAVLGWALFSVAARRDDDSSSTPTTMLDPPVDTGHDHIRGRIEAPLTLVEYGDYGCRFTGAAAETVNALRRRFGDDVRYVFRHAPNEEDHPQARLAAEAVEAAGAQGRFWEMHDRLLADQCRLELDDILGHAQALGLDVERLTENLHHGVHAAAIDADVVSAEQSGVDKTPSFFINGRRHAAGNDVATLGAALEAAERPDARPTSDEVTNP